MIGQPDPRPRVEQGVLSVSRCRDCQHPHAHLTRRCVKCRGARVAPDTVAPVGTVWASTVVHIATTEMRPPYGLCYVDVDAGPRVLAITEAVTLEVGTRVRLSTRSGTGELTAAKDHQ